jgi:hypothetical protein
VLRLNARLSVIFVIGLLASRGQGAGSFGSATDALTCNSGYAQANKLEGTNRNLRSSLIAKRGFTLYRPLGVEYGVSYTYDLCSEDGK